VNLCEVEFGAPDMPSGEPGRYTNARVNLCEVESDPLGIRIAGTLASAEDLVSAACEVRPRLLAEEVERRPPEAATAPSPTGGVVPVIEVESSDEESQGRGEPQLPGVSPEAAPASTGSLAQGSKREMSPTGVEGADDAKRVRGDICAITVDEKLDYSTWRDHPEMEYYNKSALKDSSCWMNLASTKSDPSRQQKARRR
jgi:hypothetical protein